MATSGTASGPRRAARDDRREEILAVAARLFAERGFHGVSVDDLGAAVGLTGPALYRYFAGKDALLTDMLVGISETLLDGGRERSEQAADPESALAALVAWHVDFALDHPDLIAVQFRDLDNVPEPGRSRVRQLQARYVELWVAALAGTGDGVDPARARAAVHAALGLINSTPHSARVGRDEMAGLLRDMAGAALAASAGTRVP
ncbi:MAG: TetR/AcrR family transcriptional regulator [Candidatus Nanopelagicales bacterium]